MSKSNLKKVAVSVVRWPLVEIDCTGFDKIIKNNQYSQYVNWTGVESKLSSEYFDVGFRDYTNIVRGI